MLLWISVLFVIVDADIIPPLRVPASGSSKEPGYPVLLVHGFGAAQIEAKLTGKPEVVHFYCARKTDDYFSLWLNLELLLPGIIDCFVDNMRLVYNAITGKSSPPPGVETRIPDFGGTSSMEYLDKSQTFVGRNYAYIADLLVSLGYERRKSLVGAPFDWRLAPHELGGYHDKLKSLIEKTYENNGNKPLVVVTHSMGGPAMLYFYNKMVDQAWKDKYIRSHISLAGAWGGSVRTLRMFASGDNLDNKVLESKKLRRMQRTWTASAFLLPSYNLWSPNEVLATTANKKYTLSNLKEFFTDIGHENGWSQYQHTRNLLGNLSAPNVEVHCLYGIGLKTPDSLEWPKGYFPDYTPKSKNGDGDGIVNRRSLDACSRWIGRNGGKTVTVYQVEGANHHDILESDEALKVVQKVAYGKPHRTINEIEH